MDLLPLVSTLNAKDASRVFLKQKVEKLFDGQPFVGTVTKVDRNVADASTGQLFSHLFLVKYSDGDEEHITIDELLQLLLDPSAVKDRLDVLSSVRPLQAITQPPKKRARPAGPPTDGETGSPAGENTHAPTIPRAEKTRKRPVSAMHRHVQQHNDPAPGLTQTQPTQRAEGREQAGRRPTLPFPSGGRIGAGTAPPPVPMDRHGLRAHGLPGQVKEIEVVNFKNHHHMKLEFAPHVTFISGRNGSGKSATLQALQCCLGVKAAKTGSAGALKHFIRTGAQEAIARVTMFNKPFEGYDAYQHDVFGDTITIERRISHASSTMALKNARGQTVSRRRDDLDALLSGLCINASNPVTVMTQEMAKEFLSGTSSKSDQEKFQLYMEATQLGTIAENLKVSRAAVNTMQASVADIEAKVEEQDRTIKELEKKAEHLSGIDAWQVEVDRLEKCVAWVSVGEAENAVAQIEGALGKLPEKAEEAAEAAGVAEREAQALAERMAAKKTFLENFEANTTRIGDDESRAKAAFKAARKEVGRLRAKVGKLEGAVEEHRRQKQALETAMANADDAAMAQTQAAVAEYAQGLEAAQQRHKLATTKTVELRVQVKAREDAISAAAEQLDRIKESLRTAESDVSNLTSHMNAFKAARGSDAAAVIRCGGNVGAQLARAVEDAVKRGRFHRPPLGPVGRYLVLEDEKWATAMEAAVGMTLNNYLVGDKHDCHVLNGLMQQLRIPLRDRPRVCVMRLDLPRHHVPPHMQPPPHVPTVLRMLRCTSPEAESSVMNYLIDQARIEQLALADSIQDARSLAQHQRVASAYTSDGQRAYKRKNTLTTEPVPMWLRNGYRAPRLSAAEGTTGREAAQDLEKRLADARQRVIDLRAAVMVSQAAYEEAREVAKRYRLELCEASRHCMMTQAGVDDLMSQIPPEVAATQADGSLGDAQTAEEIIQATQAVIDFEEQLDEARTELAAAEAKESEAHAALETAKQTMEQLAAENAELLDSFAAEMAEEEKARALAETYRTELAALQETRGHLERQLQETREQAMEITMVAEMVCAREDGAAAKQEVEQALLSDGKSRREGFMESFFTCAVLNQKIDRLRKKIADAEREAGGSLEMIQGELDAQLAERRHKGAEQRNALEMHKAFRESLKQRKRKLQEIDQLTESTVNSRFNDYMKRKGHVGRVQLHREQQRLTLSVRIGERAGEGSGAVKDLKQLSGGERSYTTVAFTLALRGETESPFVAMDEVDVFMDNVNRRVAMENLFSFAREQAELQMVVLSPLSVDVIADVQRSTQWPKEFIKVVQMQPARE